MPEGLGDGSNMISVEPYRTPGEGVELTRP